MKTKLPPPEAEKIQYRLTPIPNRNGGNGGFAARAVVRSLGLKQIAEQMVREGSKYSENEIIAIADQLFSVVLNRLKNGFSINLGSMLRIRPSIKGKFEREDEAFDPKKHKIFVAVSVGRWLREKIQDTKVAQVK